MRLWYIWELSNLLYYVGAYCWHSLIYGTSNRNIHIFLYCVAVINFWCRHYIFRRVHVRYRLLRVGDHCSSPSHSMRPAAVSSLPYAMLPFDMVRLTTTLERLVPRLAGVQCLSFMFRNYCIEDRCWSAVSVVADDVIDDLVSIAWICGYCSLGGWRKLEKLFIPRLPFWSNPLSKIVEVSTFVFLCEFWRKSSGSCSYVSNVY
jgi:hypothetical protein